MRLTELPARLAEKTIRTWRRRLMAGAIAAACGLAAVIEGIAAARLALDAVVGPIGSRLILVAVFGLLISAVMLWLRWRERAPARRDTERPSGSAERVATIAEAIDLGYALGREFWHGKRADPQRAQSASAANGAAGDAPSNGAAAPGRP